MNQDIDNLINITITNFNEYILLRTKLKINHLKTYTYESEFIINQNLRDYLENNEEFLKGRATCKLSLPIDPRLSNMYSIHLDNCIKSIFNDVDNKVLSERDLIGIEVISKIISENFLK